MYTTLIDYQKGRLHICPSCFPNLSSSPIKSTVCYQIGILSEHVFASKKESKGNINSYTFFHLN